MRQKFNRVKLVFSKEKKEARKLALEVIKILRQKAMLVDDFQKADVVITFGGDGLVLKVADQIAQKGLEIPILRVNFGRRGFLCNLVPEIKEIKRVLFEMSREKFEIRKRLRIEADIQKRDSVVSFSSLNEMVIGGITRTVGLKLNLNLPEEQIETETRGDGIIVATPTGSTAYNLNALGPILLCSDCFVVLANNGNFEGDFFLPQSRAIVIPANSEIEARNIIKKRKNLPFLIADGQREYRLSGRDRVVIRKASLKTLFLEIES